MFKDETLQNHLETSSTIRLQSSVIAEWNMNIASNVLQVGNYRYRRNAVESNVEDYPYVNIASSFDANDSTNAIKFYTDATDSDIVVDGGYKNDKDLNTTPAIFLSKKEKEKLLYSLDDCFGRFRPRSGINKLRYFSNRYTHHSNPDLASRPRYYIADRYDQFKYWTSYRTENGIERGIANKTVNSQNVIDDTAPFVVYKDPVPANRIVVKMQTGVGSVDLGPFVDTNGTFSDPFYGDNNKSTPVNWKIQYLENNNWVDAVSFNNNSIRRNGSSIIKEDGYVELGYGLIVPDEYLDIFMYSGEYPSATLLPDIDLLTDGVAYLIKESETDIGTFYIALDGEYKQFIAKYGWYVDEEDVTNLTNYVTDLTAPSQFFESTSANPKYREFQYVNGLRVVVETMNTFDSTFDLIELSPRLSVDLSDKTKSFSIKKSASDLGVSGLPVGQLLASTGSLDLFDYDQAFFTTNPSSIVSKYVSQNIQIKFYEIILDVNGNDYYVPIKTMYSEGFPQISSTDRSVTLPLRDLFFYFESLTAPQLLIQNASTSYAISMLLDSVGFSNYTFLRVPDEPDMIIPYFSVGPDMTLAQILSDIAVSSQSAMFFDEYNNFVVMSKNYIMPAVGQRTTDVDATLYGSKDFVNYGVVKNKQGKLDSKGNLVEIPKLANIKELSSADNVVYNDGSINYTSRYIQKSYSSIKQASLIDRDKTWIYKPALLWEVSPPENTKSVNDEVAQQSGYILSAIPLNSDLSDALPSVENHQIINNVIDFGDGVYWLGRYNGYFYANGEIVKYDAVQYSIPGLVGVDDPNIWITSTQEYQRYFSKVPFNGKIYPTGLVRIYAEPNYETVEGITRLKNGAVAKHGRMQFGTGSHNTDGTTKPVYHNAGLSNYWSNDEYVRGIDMDFTYLSNSGRSVVGATPGSYAISLTNGPAGVDNERAKTTTRNGIIKNFLSNTFIEESTVNRLLSTQTGTIQSSALVINGSSTSASTESPGFVSYVYKELEDRFIHFGTRMRIVGKIENNESRGQSPFGVSTYYTSKTKTSDQFISIGGSSGGLGVMVDPTTNVGYYFEVMALTENNLSQYEDADTINNVIFYKVMQRDAPNVTITGKQLTSNVATITTSTAHKFIPGDQVTVSQVDTVFNGLYTITSVNEARTTFSYTKENADVAFTGGLSATASIIKDKAIPVKLWGGLANIVVDDGLFTGQYRVAAEETPTVYDISVEYRKVGNALRFYLYINNVLIKSIDDPEPLPIHNNIALFTRGSSRVMFENVYALTNNYSQNTTFGLDVVADSVFSDTEINAANSFQKYSMNGLIQSTYLTGVGTSEAPKYKIYFEEFGTIMREAAYFNVRYDKAYPALYAKLAPTFNKIKGYTVSGFTAGAYRSEFLVFNATDTALNLDSTSGNYLRILGVTFTQQSQHELTVDEYFSKRSDLSNPEFSGDAIVRSPQKVSKDYTDIKFSRMTHGKKQFSITAPYIQSQDDANNLMEWLSKKIMKPRRSIGIKVFGMPTLQLGDIVSVDYTNADGIDEVASPDTRFTIYSIEYNRDNTGPEMTVYLSEVT